MMDICQRIEKLIEKFLHDEGYACVRVSYSGTKRKTLQIMIERTDEQDINIDDCEKVSRLLSPLLDVEGNLSESYILEVSSPGMDRPLVKIKDYIRFIGHAVYVQTIFSHKNRKKFQGRLESATENGIKILLDQPNDDKTDDVSLNYSDIRSARLRIEF